MTADDREDLVRAATAAVRERLRAAAAPSFVAPVGVSGRHCHLTPGDLATLFGGGAGLHEARALRQPGQFAAVEEVAVIGPGGVLPGVRVVGPLRSRSVVEVGAADLFRLGLAPGLSPGKPVAVTLAGPAGVVRLTDGGVISRRHLHASPAEAERLGVRDGMVVAARLGVPGRRVVFDDVLVRVGADMALELHLDRDEANACGARDGDEAEVLLEPAASSPATAAPGAGRRAKVLITEEDVVRAHREGRPPAVRGALLTPWARDALHKYFPELGEE